MFSSLKIQKVIITSILLLFVSLVSKANATDIPKQTNQFIGIKTFSEIEVIENILSESEYFDFIRANVINQPEYQYSQSDIFEKNQLVKFAKRQRLPDLSTRVINDQVLERNVSDAISLRKRQDDSFDGVVELNQPIYTGGSINAQIRQANARKKQSVYSQGKTLSTLVIQANTIYLSAVISDFIFHYSENIREDLKPYLSKVKDRVQAGLSDPIELAVFSIKYNEFENLYHELKALSNRDKDIFEYFFKQEYTDFNFPEILISNWQNTPDKSSYEVELAQQNLLSIKEDEVLVKSEYRPKIGISTRYTRYDLNENLGEDDIRGGVYFNAPIFTFGKASAKISAARATSKSAEYDVRVKNKEDEVREREVFSTVENLINIRDQLKNSFSDTISQRNIIKDRIELTGFNANSFAESSIDELIQLQKLLNSEKSLIISYFELLHQNQRLINYFRLNQ